MRKCNVVQTQLGRGQIPQGLSYYRWTMQSVHEKSKPVLLKAKSGLLKILTFDSNVSVQDGLV